MNTTSLRRIGGFRAIAAALFCSFGAAVPCAAQTSTSFRLTEMSFNNGGNPDQGMTLASAHFRISLDGVGAASIAAAVASPSFLIDGGFVSNNRPPGEVSGLQFATPTDIVWNREPSVGSYNLYRAVLSTLPGGYGACYQAGLQSTSWTESGSPATGSGWLYLVTAKNRLGEEGTKGYGTGGIERSNNAPCP